MPCPFLGWALFQLGFMDRNREGEEELLFLLMEVASQGQNVLS